MSWGVCYSGSNNINFNFPPIMSDGRNYATWDPAAVVNQRIQQKEGITSNWNYRQYLQNNGLQIMNYNSAESCYVLGLDPHVKSDNSDLKNPYLTREQLNARLIAPSVNPANYQKGNM